MQKNIFEKLSAPRCYITRTQVYFYDFVVRANSVIYVDSAQILWTCDRFPNYAGNPKNVRLQASYFDLQTHEIGRAFIQGCRASIALFTAWKGANKPHTRRMECALTDADFADLMRHDRKHKRGTGGVRLSAKVDATITDSLRYNQVTEPAYWANIGVNSYTGETCKNSGNASLVAANIKN